MSDTYILGCTILCVICLITILWVIGKHNETTGSLITEMKRLRQELDEHEEEHKRLRSRISSIPKVGDN